MSSSHSFHLKMCHTYSVHRIAKNIKRSNKFRTSTTPNILYNNLQQILRHCILTTRPQLFKNKCVGVNFVRVYLGILYLEMM